MRRFQFQLIVTGIVLSVTSSLIAGTASEAAEVFNQLYKSRIDRAVASRDTADNTALADELLSATGEAGDSAHLFTLMCESAYTLTNRVPASYDTAIRAMEMLARRVPDRALGGLLKIIDVRNRQFRGARGDERASIGADLIDDYTKAGDVAHEQGDLAGAAKFYQRAIPVCSAIRSAERMADVKAKIAQVKSRLLIRREIETCTNRLAANPDDRETHLKLIKLCIVDLDRPKNAIDHLKHTDKDNPMREMVPMAIKPLESLKADEYNKLAQWYLNHAKRAAKASQPAMLTRSKHYFDQYLTLHNENDLHRARAMLFLKDVDQRLERVGGLVPVSLVMARPRKIEPVPSIKPPKPGSFPGGLIAYWKFNEGSGDTVRDFAGGRNGTLKNGADWVNDAGKPAVAFRGQGAHVATTFDQHLTKFTFCTWVKADRPHHIAKPAGPFHYEKNFQINWTHRSLGSRGAIIMKFGTWRAAKLGPLPPDMWHHIAGSYDGETMRAYVNGVLMTVNTAPSGSPVKEKNKLVFGTNAAARSNGFQGAVRDAMIFDRTLSDHEVASLAGRPSKRDVRDGLIANWDFDVRKGPNIIDTSGNGNDGIYFPAVLPGSRAGARDTTKALVNYGASFASFGNIGDFDSTDAFSYGGWIYPVRTTGDRAVLTKMEYRPPLSGYDLWLQGRKPIVHLISHWQNGNAIKVVSNRTLGLHKWFHVMATYDGSSSADGVRIFVDGKETRHEVLHDNLTGSMRTPAPLHLFSRNGAYRFQGMVDDVRVYGHELSQTEIRELAANRPTSVFPMTPAGQPAKVNTLSEGLVGHWPFDDGSGKTARDASGNGNRGQLAGGVEWTKGRIGGALSFGKDRSHVVIGNPEILNFKGEITLAAWIKMRSRNSSRAIIAHGATTEPKAETDLRLRNYQYAMVAWNGHDRGVEFGIPESDNGQWVHLAGMYDGQFWRMYRNGVLVSARENDRGASLVEQDWVIGSRGTKDGRWFDGEIDDVRIYNRALTFDEVRALAAAMDSSSVENEPQKSKLFD